jgi:hypothetical protein
MKNVSTLGTWLPCFPGFYNTEYEPDLDCELHQLNIDYIGDGVVTHEDVDWDYQQYELDVVKHYIDYVNERLKPYQVKLELEKIVSPKEYNFKNDAVDVIATYSIPRLQAWVKSHYGYVSSIIARDYRSCEGFMSHYSNDPEEWLEDAYEHPHKLGKILDMLLKKANTFCAEEAYDYVYSNVVVNYTLKSESIK